MTTQPALQVPNDVLTKKLLRKAVGGSNSLYSFLELLCVDDLYVFKDDFDDPELKLSPYWTADHLSTAIGVTDMVLVGGETGWARGTPGGTDDGWLRLFGPGRWAPSRRCTVMGRFDGGRTPATKIEFGFMSGVVELSDQALSGGVLLKATPTANSYAADFALGAYDYDDNTDFDLIVQRGATVGHGDQEGGPRVANLAGSGPFTLMVSLTEGGGSRLWINGAPVAKHQAAYGTVQSTERPLISPVGVLSIWFFMQNREDTYDNFLSIDYVQAWQERVART